MNSNIISSAIPLNDNTVFYLCENRETNYLPEWSIALDKMAKSPELFTTLFSHHGKYNCIKIYAENNDVEIIKTTPDRHAYICIINNKLALVCSFFMVSANEDRIIRCFVGDRNLLAMSFDYITTVENQNIEWVKHSINTVFKNQFKYCCKPHE